MMPVLSVLLVLTVYAVTCVGGQGHQSSEDQYVFPKVGMFKFVAYVSSKAGFCTGTIINEDWILTAAHCFWFRKKIINHGDARILTGVTNYEQPNAHSKQDTMSEEIHVHPSFHYNKLSKYDVALVKVRDRMTFGDYVGAIEVAADGWPQEANASLDCYTLGFGGYYSTAPATADLKVWNVTLASHGEDSCPCARRFQYKRLVCVKESMARMCKGDDGGPLICGNKVRAIGHMVGDRATCDDPVYPLHKCVGGPEKVLSTFMFLCPVNSWLNSIVSDIPETPVSCRAPPHWLPSFTLVATYTLFIWAVISKVYSLFC